MTGSALYLDDLGVGDTFTSREHRIDEGQIVLFASEFDPQPFHLDDEAAKGTFFRGLAASGWHTAAITMRLVVESVPFAAGIIGAAVELSWASPTRPSESLHVESRIVEINPSRTKPNQALVVLESRTINSAGELKQTLTSKLLAFKKSA